MSETPIKAIIYKRVSSRSQEEEGHGLESQEARCRLHAAARGYEVVACFQDTFTGAGDFMQRPGMVALFSCIDAQPGVRFVVIFDDLKRLSRDTRAFLDLRDAFRLRGVGVECLNFKFDDTPEAEFVETVIAAQGMLERQQNGRQVAQKMRARMKNGYWIHNPPVGYRYETFKGRGKMLVANPPFDGIVREAYEGYACGRFRSQAEVKRFFESFPEFPRNRYGAVTNQRVADILSQPVYAGYICSETYGIDWLKGQHEGLISVETYDKVQALRQEAAYGPRRKNIGDDFALRGFVCCAGCSVPLRSSWVKGRSKHYAYYVCQTKSCESYGKSIARDKIEGEVGEVIRTLQPTEGLFKLATAMFRFAWDARRAQARDAIEAGRREIGAIEKDVESLLTRIVGATHTSAIGAYEKRLAQLERRKIVIADKLARQDEPKGKFEEKLEPVLAFLANPWKLWESGHITLRRTVLRLAFTERLQYCRKEGARTAQIALPFKALGQIPGPDTRSGAG